MDCSPLLAPLAPLEKRLYLAPDCYAFVFLMGSGFQSLWLATIVFVLQATILFFYATDESAFFQNGRWLTPISAHWSVNAMKGVSLTISVLKLFNEFHKAATLHQCYLRAVATSSARATSAAFVAVTQQWAVAMSILVVSVHLILAAQNAKWAMINAITIWFIMDVDEYATAFVLFCKRWPHFDWGVEAEDFEDKETMPSAKRSILMCGVIPALILSVMLGVAISVNTLPLTYVRFLQPVSNDAAPDLLVGADTPAGCCGPLIHNVTTTTVDVDVLLIGAVYEAAPRVTWVAVRQGLPAPSSLQIMLGRDGESNAALAAGSLPSQHVQSAYWLARHGFDKTEDYAAIEKHIARMNAAPFHASFRIGGLPPAQQLNIYVGAVNPSNLALPPIPVDAMATMQTCAAHCRDCRFASPGHCSVCEVGFRLESDWTCGACDKNCVRCGKTPGASCDLDGCAPGFTYLKGTGCLDCNIPHCDSCRVQDSNVSEVRLTVCTACKKGFVAGAGGAACFPCGIAGCERCDQVEHCGECQRGYGRHTLLGNITEVLADLEKNTAKTDLSNETLSMVRQELRVRADAGKLSVTKCAKCSENCDTCSEAETCDEGGCYPGFTSKRGACEPCAAHCVNCTETRNCNDGGCRYGYGVVHGLSSGRNCVKCLDDNCLECDGNPDVCSKCDKDYGITARGTCDMCASNCAVCEKGFCLQCSAGFGLDRDAGKCMPCADACEMCLKNGPGKCDPGGCRPGFGLLEEVCYRCRADHCYRCDDGPLELHCDECAPLATLTSNKTCKAVFE